MGDYSWGGAFETAAEENRKLRSDLEMAELDKELDRQTILLLRARLTQYQAAVGSILGALARPGSTISQALVACRDAAEVLEEGGLQLVLPKKLTGREKPWLTE